jgi:hypothetical protein
MVERSGRGIWGLHLGSWLRHRKKWLGGINGLQVDVKLFEDLGEVERDAGQALDRANQPSLFARLSWFRLVAEHSPPPGKLLVARAQTRQDEWGRTAVWLFLSEDKDKAESFANWYSLRTDPVHFQRDLPETPACLAAIAKTLRQRGIATLVLPRLDQDPEELVAAFRGAGWYVHAEPHVVSWQIDTDMMDFFRYWSRRPSRLRNTAERKTKAAGLDIEIHREFSDQAWADYESIYAASWKPEEGSPALLRALAVQESDAGTLRLGIARKDGQPVAAQLWLVENEQAMIHKLAYRDDAKELSPGTVLSMAMFRAALDEDRVVRIDYGTGDDGYKKEWMEERNLLWRLEAYNPSTLAGAVAVAKARVSALVGRLRSR